MVGTPGAMRQLRCRAPYHSMGVKAHRGFEPPYVGGNRRRDRRKIPRTLYLDGVTITGGVTKGGCVLLSDTDSVRVYLEGGWHPQENSVHCST